MKVLHYALGFPPYRSGGLTKFCVDLMVQQISEGHTVALLWPGQMRIINKEVSIKKHEDEKLREKNIQSFEIVNPLPVPFDEGIAETEAFMQDADINVYNRFIDEIKPDIIHVHTLMGLHKSFLIAAKNKKIRLVFTAHDFFPICPKVTMFRHGEICSCVKTCEDCGRCNATALSLNKIKILQSPLYRKLKDSVIVKKIRKQHRDEYLSESVLNKYDNSVGTADDYKRLRYYYNSLLCLMDMIHYNSSVTKNVYESFFEFNNKCIVNITHSDIKDNRIKKNYKNKKLHIRYLGPMGGGKGFFILKEALDNLWSIRQDFILDVHFSPAEMPSYMKVHEKYSYSDLKDIFEKTDVLIVPSVWYETFGFTVIEALSYGVPVVISGNVGAKDILANGTGIIIENITAKKLYDVLRNLTFESLQKMNAAIIEKQLIMQIDTMSKIIEKECYEWKI